MLKILIFLLIFKKTFLKFLSSECPVLSILLIVNYPSLQFSFESFFFVSVKVVFSFKDILVCSILRRIFPRCPRQFPIFESQTVNTFSQASLSHFSFRPKIKKNIYKESPDHLLASTSLLFSDSSSSDLEKNFHSCTQDTYCVDFNPPQTIRFF